MLSLTRRPGEEIVITDTVSGEEIIVTPLRIDGNHTRIGIQASRRFAIARRELLERDTVSEPD